MCLPATSDRMPLVFGTTGSSDDKPQADTQLAIVEVPRRHDIDTLDTAITQLLHTFSPLVTLRGLIQRYGIERWLGD